MKMTTEEAFVKVLQMHGIEHAFGIIGSAMMPVSDLFPASGITFWDVADEKNGGYMADGFTRATGKMSMAIAQNGTGSDRLCYRHKDCVLEPFSDSFGHAAGSQPNDWAGRFPGGRANEFSSRTWFAIRKNCEIQLGSPRC